MSATTAPETMADVTSEGLLATLRGAPAGETPTRDAEPVQEKAPADRAPDLAADGSRQRDDRGRFAPRRSPLDALVEGSATTPTAAEAGQPATPAQGQAAPAAAPAAQPAPQAPAPSPAQTELQARLNEAERLNQALRGQVNNAARQAEERGKAAARQHYRDEVRQEYQALVSSGEATPDQVRQALGQKEEEWARADEQVQRRALGQERVELTLADQEGAVREKTFALYHTAAPLLARDHGLDTEHVRAVWADDGERERFQRATHQAEAARNFPRGGFNAAGLEDYLATVDHFLGREAQLHKAYQAELATARKAANRQDADASGVFRAPASGRGGAPVPKAPETLGDITREHWLAALRRNRPRSA